jgi:putative ABC transport system permease protein
MQTLWQDLRYGARMLMKKPGFTLIAALTLALGIGANTAIFSSVNTFLFRPAPVERPRELVMAFVGGKQQARVWDHVSYPDYFDFRAENRVFTGVAAYKMTSVAFAAEAASRASDNQGADVIWGEIVSGNYFDVLGVRAALGRTFMPAEDVTPGAHPVVVLSHSFWQRRFNANPDALGCSVSLNGHPFTVIGIAPPAFKGMKFALGFDFWAPMMMRTQLEGDDGWRTARGWNHLSVLSRLKPGVTVQQAEADLNLITKSLAERYPDASKNKKVNVVPEIEGRYDEYYGFLKLIAALALAVSALAPLVACANVANLLLARATARRREMGIRLAVGAGRSRIVRQLLTESLLLALLGGGGGLLLAFWGADLIAASVPNITPYRVEIDFNPDLRVLAWALSLSLATGLVFGLAPAWRAAGTDLVSVLKSELGSGGNHARRWNMQNLLVVAQLAISVVALVVGGLFVKSLYVTQKADPGFQSENLLSLRLDPGLVGYDAVKGRQFYAELTQRVGALPGVRAASLAGTLPLGDDWMSTAPVIKEGDAPPPPNQGMEILFSSVGAMYFETTGTPLALGRDFTDRDREGAPAVAIINQEAAQRLFGSAQNALGKRLRASREGALLEIVGIARNGRYRNLVEEPRPYLFLPVLQSEYQSQLMLLVRAASAGQWNSIVADVRRTAQQLDPRVPIFNLNVGAEHLRFTLWGPRLAAGIATTFALLSLVVAKMGLYGVMTYAVSQRTKEIGIRMALGAHRTDVLRLVVGQGLALICVGVVIGLGAALALTRLLRSLLFGVSATDPFTFVAVALLLAGVALLACWIPARRATKVDPMIALRCD